ncbi:MAG: DnaJ domain-containing protein [Pirellulales bacterium]
MLSRDEPPDHLVNIAARLGLGCLATGIMGLTVFQVVSKPPLKLTVLQSVCLLLVGCVCAGFAEFRHTKLMAEGKPGIVTGHADKALAHLKMIVGVSLVGFGLFMSVKAIQQGIGQGGPPLTLQDYPLVLVVLAFIFGLGVLFLVHGKKALNTIADKQKGIDPRPQHEPGHKKRSGGQDLDSSAEALNVLGLRLGASNDDIEEAYRILAKVWHPDRYMDDPQLRPIAEANIKRINWAFGYLEEFPPEVTQEEARFSKWPANQVAAHSTSAASPARNRPSCAGEWGYDIRRVFSAGTPLRQRIGWLFGMAGGSLAVGGVAYHFGYPDVPLLGTKGLLLLSGVGLVGVSKIFGFPKRQGPGGMDVATTVGTLIGAGGMLCAFGSGFIACQNSWSDANVWLIAKCVCASLAGMMVYVGGRNQRVESKGVSLAPKRGQRTR